MTRIGHLTDFHLIEEEHARRRGMAKARLRFLSATRALDARARWDRVARALAEARGAELDHLVITGDVTEDGSVAQFELLAELLAESGIPPERVTLVAGNHDQYGGGGWAEALAGPLRPHAATSAPGVVIDAGDARITTVPSAVAQHWFWASGRIEQEDLGRLAGVAREAGGKAVLAVTHHPWRTGRDPITRALRGLANAGAARALLLEHPAVHVVHGHLHARVDTSAGEGGEARVFGAPAVVDAPGPPLRVYRAGEGRIVSL